MNINNEELKKIIENYNFKDILNIFRNVNLTTSELELINTEINANLKDKEQRSIRMLNSLLEGNYNKEEFSNNIKNIKNYDIVTFFITLEKTINKDKVNANKNIILDCLLAIYNEGVFPEKTNRKNYRKKLRNFLFNNMDVKFLEEIKKKDLDIYESIKNTNIKKNYSYENKDLIYYYFKNEFIDEDIIVRENITSKELIEYLIENNKTNKTKNIINENILFLDKRYIDKYFKDNNIYKINWTNITIDNLKNIITKNKSENLKYISFNIDGAKCLIDILKDYIKNTFKTDENKNKNINEVYQIIKNNFSNYQDIIDSIENIDYKFIKYLKLEYELKEMNPISQNNIDNDLKEKTKKI